MAFGLGAIHIMDPRASDLAHIRVPEITSDCVFGGADRRRLFIIASSSLYAIATKVTGSGVAARVLREAQA